MARPVPPQDLTNPNLRANGFHAAPELESWARATFIERQGGLHNPDHRHLQLARIGFLWAGPAASRAGKTIVGTAEIFSPKGGAWQRERQRWQLVQWFGTAELDFIVTIDAVYANLCSDFSFCALLEHELYHCGQATDPYGTPRFSRSTGRPIYTMRGHDAEEFVGVVRRYGVGAAAGGVRQLVDAAAKPPEVGKAEVAAACGNCLRLVA